MSNKLSPETKKLLKKIQEHLDAAETLFQSINDVDNQLLLDYHAENHSLNHCIRWGVVACNDLIE